MIVWINARIHVIYCPFYYDTHAGSVPTRSPFNGTICTGDEYIDCTNW